MAKTGWTKKYNNLKLVNVYIEEEDIELLKKEVEQYNNKHNMELYSLSILIREIISNHCKNQLWLKKEVIN